MMFDSNERGFLIIVSAPSGAGKTTLCKRVEKECKNIKHSISYTTRKPRANEKDGREYYFIHRKEFEEMIQSDLFIEWAEVHGNLYGTSRENLERDLMQGYSVILDIDVQGAKLLREKRSDEVFVFVLPPSFDTLRERLSGRGSDSQEEIEKRLDRARKEISFCREYDYVIVNDNIEKAVSELKSIIIAEWCAAKRFLQNYKV